MQPEIDIKHVQNGKPEAGIRQATAIEQWDHVAFKLVGDILAPKGFKEVKNGSWRGLKIANADQPGLVKAKVNQCQKASAQLVRTYRQKAKARLEVIYKEIEQWIKEDQRKYNACHFWEFRKKTELKYKIKSLLGQNGSVSRIIHELDNIGIK
jgi:hypothetical protein